jgi:hypothetical protein
VPKPPEGLPGYGWEKLLKIAGLANLSMMRERRKQPAEGQQPVGYYWTGHAYTLLYRAEDTVDMPPLSPGRQRLWDAARTCARCGKRSEHGPWDRGRDNQRYCSPCQEPAARELWEQERAADRPIVAEWARATLADPSLVLFGAQHETYWRVVHVEDVAGRVLLDGVRVRWQDTPLDPTHPEAAALAAAMTPAGLVDALAGRRVLTWWRPSPSWPPARADQAGHWYSRWVGQAAGGSCRFDPRLAEQQPPADARAQVGRIREVLAEMAGGG